MRRPWLPLLLAPLIALACCPAARGQPARRGARGVLEDEPRPTLTQPDLDAAIRAALADEARGDRSAGAQRMREAVRRSGARSAKAHYFLARMLDAPAPGPDAAATEAERREALRAAAGLLGSTDYPDQDLWAGHAADRLRGLESSPVHARLVERYGDPAVYAAIERRVRGFYPPGKSNGCVAYMSEALRDAGVPVPHRADASGEDISLVTLPFSRYLEQALGWRRITREADLRPGDVCFTQDDPRYPGYPAHTFMFLRWHDAARGLAYVVDNQAHTHLRNLREDDPGNYNFTPFGYALRAPR